MTNGRYYSVDEKWIGTELNVVTKGQEVQIYHQGQLLETHQKLNTPHLKNSTKSHHMGPWRRALSEMSIYRRAAKQYGPQVETFIKMALERGNGYIDTTTLWGVLSFQKEYGSLMLNEACEWAIGIEAPTYRAVKSYLDLMAKRPPKRTIIQSK